MSELAVLGCTVSITSGHTTPNPIVITTQPSSNVSVNGKGVYKGTISVTVAPIADPSGNTSTGGTITIDGSGSNCLVDGSNAVLKNDSGSQSFPFVNASSAPVGSQTVSIKITDAGQTDVNAL